MQNSIRTANFYVMIVIDLLCFAAALYTAYLLRFDFYIPYLHYERMLGLLPWILPMKLAIFMVFSMYRGMWRYTSLLDSILLMRATCVQSLLLIAGIAYLTGFAGYSRAVFGMDFLLTFLFTGGARLAIRIMFSLMETGRFWLPMTGKDARKGAKRVIIIGAGRAGERLVSELNRDLSLGYFPVGFVDNNPSLKGRTIHGRPVMGTLDRLPEAIVSTRAEEILIALTEASSAQVRSIVEACSETGLPCKILPPMNEILDFKRGVKNMREVNYLDLLGRTPVELDTAAISRYLEGKTILVTGCGGSIGSELVRQIVRFAPSKLVLVDSSEFNLYKIQMELEHAIGFRDYAVVLGNIRDAELMRCTFIEHKPEAVFHAAAYKHVPMLERNPWQAVENNILGTQTLMQAAHDAEVERFVVVSTDKAVRPTNVMGASKRVTELLMRRFANSRTRFMAVRFGNVVGSSGSVVPLFLDQIAKGGPVTVTHPEVTRYFMSIAEAAQLILQAGTMAHGGEIFVLDMGVPVKIADMAKDLIRLAGLEPDVDIPIVFTGLREGEKLYEELITADEGVVRTEHDKIMVLRCCDESHISAAAQEHLQQWLAAAAAAAEAHDGQGVRGALQKLVPEYAPYEPAKQNGLPLNNLYRCQNENK
ncbi:polysaccharide biosynthesis protein [Oleidesulfovibrio sp.]|uniref:polysaccharide biosynthesis protein n=1 Tax=Oleidesulfovibrio sp. TaxID=2909707 RepID=UPI003A86BFA2